MSHFPFIIQRIAGLPAQAIDTLNLSSLDDESKYVKDKAALQEQLKNYMHNPDLQAGLLFSSHSFTQRLRHYLLQNSDNKKKQEQAYKSLTQYLYRMATKTTPFSTFCFLDVISIEEGISLLPDSDVQRIWPNQAICTTLQSILDFDIIKEDIIILNPTIQIRGDYYTFLINSQNIESFQQIECNDFLEWLYNLLVHGKISFAELVNKACSVTDIDKLAVKQYCTQLIRVGFLMLKDITSCWDVHWPHSLAKRFKAEDGVLADILQNIATVKNISQQRQTELSASLNARMHYWLQDNQETKDVSEVAFQQFSLEPPDITPERLVYQDVARSVSVHVDSAVIEQLISDLQLLMRTVAFNVPTSGIEYELKQFIKQCFSDGSRIPLLDFYEQFTVFRKNYKGLTDIEHLFPEDLSCVMSEDGAMCSIHKTDFFQLSQNTKTDFRLPHFPRRCFLYSLTLKMKNGNLY